MVGRVEQSFCIAVMVRWSRPGHPQLPPNAAYATPTLCTPTATSPATRCRRPTCPQRRGAALSGTMSWPPVCAGWLLHVPGAEESTLSEMEEAARALDGSGRWEVFEITLGRVRE